jgi:hypothetical protein
MGVHCHPRALWYLGSIALLLAACSPQQTGDAAVCAAYTSQTQKQEVVADGTVTRLLGTRRGPSGTHEGFLLKLSTGCDLTLRVETNTDLTGPVPLQRGEHAVVKGEYVYYALGGVLHWTHHDPRFRHEAGYVRAGGETYQ